MPADLNFKISDDAWAALVAFAPTYRDPQNGQIVSIYPAAAIYAMFQNLIIAPAINYAPSSALIAAQAALEAAKASIASIVFNSITDYAFQFDITCANPGSSITHGSTGTAAFTYTVLDPSYTGTITFSLIDGNALGITGAFSPSTATATGSGTLTITVPGSVPAGSYDIEVRGTDTDNVIKQVTITIVVI